MLNLKKSLESFTLSEDTRRKILNENHPFGNQGTPFIPSEFKEIAQIADEDAEADRVYQLQLLFFPFSE